MKPSKVSVNHVANKLIIRQSQNGTVVFSHTET